MQRFAGWTGQCRAKRIVTDVKLKRLAAGVGDACGHDGLSEMGWCRSGQYMLMETAGRVLLCFKFASVGDAGRMVPACLQGCEVQLELPF